MAAAVAGLVDDVRTRGDIALREITLRLDGVDLASFSERREFAAARVAIAPELVAAMRRAALRIEAFHKAGMEVLVSASSEGMD